VNQVSEEVPRQVSLDKNFVPLLGASIRAR